MPPLPGPDEGASFFQTGKALKFSDRVSVGFVAEVFPGLKIEVLADKPHSAIH
jgi:hypothetical protein